MWVNNSFHISYCTNIHPGRDWHTTFAALRDYLPQIRAAVAGNEKFGVGLRLSNQASEELGTGKQLLEFRKWLDEQGLYVFTMNGFPYGNFHEEPVKAKVHAPDWGERPRLEYTKRLFTQLAELLPSGLSGGISTSPLSYKHWHSSDEAKKSILNKGAGHMAELIVYLNQLERERGVYMHLDIEPEPDGLLENSEEVVQFFTNALEPVAIPYLSRELGINQKDARELIYRHITVCYDVCHFSLAYESAALSFQRFKDAGIQIGKIQVSAALRILFPEAEEEAIWESLVRFDEPIYLHQVTELREGKVYTYPDLPEVLGPKARHDELRAHFHVPIFLSDFGGLHATQDQILEVLEYLRHNRITDQLEVETYTWEVLPAALKKPLGESIVRELQWLLEKLGDE